MKYLQPKSPDSTRFYVIDYSKLIGSDIINRSTMTVASGSVSVIKQVWNNSAIGMMISGGTIGETDTINITINTQAGQIFTDVAALLIVANEDNLDFSVVTKDTIIEFAFQDLRISGYIFDKSPNMLSAMLSRLDALMRQWRLQGMDVGYNHPPKIGQSNLNDIAGIEDGITAMVATCLAKEYMEGIGKTLNANFISRYNKAWNWLYAQYRSIPFSKLPTNTPRGSGGKLYSVYFPFMLDQATTNEESLLNAVNGSQYIIAGVWDDSLWNKSAWG